VTPVLILCEAMFFLLIIDIHSAISQEAGSGCDLFQPHYEKTGLLYNFNLDNGIKKVKPVSAEEVRPISQGCPPTTLTSP